MRHLRGITVLVLAAGLMALLGVIVIDEFQAAAEADGELDSNIIELLQMAITGVIGIVAGYVSGKADQ